MLASKRFLLIGGAISAAIFAFCILAYYESESHVSIPLTKRQDETVAASHMEKFDRAVVDSVRVGLKPDNPSSLELYIAGRESGALRDAFVSLVPQKETTRWLRRTNVLAVSGDTGVVALPSRCLEGVLSGEQRLVVSHAAHMSRELSVAGLTTADLPLRKTVLLDPATQQSFVVRDDSGGPVAGCTIIMCKSQELTDADMRVSVMSGVGFDAISAATSNSAGLAVVGGLAGGQYRYTVESDEWLVAGSDAVRGVVQVSSTPVAITVRRAYAGALVVPGAKIIAGDVKYIGSMLKNGGTGQIARVRRMLQKRWPDATVFVGHRASGRAAPKVAWRFLLEGRGWVAGESVMRPVVLVTAPDVVNPASASKVAMGRVAITVDDRGKSFPIMMRVVGVGEEDGQRISRTFWAGEVLQLPAGDYSARPVHVDCHRVLKSKKFHISGGGVETVKFELPVGNRVQTVTVLSPDKRSATAANIKVVHSDKLVGGRITQGEEKQILILPIGRSVVDVWAAGCKRQSRVVDVSAVSADELHFELQWESE